MPEDVQHHIGKLFVGNKQWAQSVLAQRTERLAREHERLLREEAEAARRDWEFLRGVCGT